MDKFLIAKATDVGIARQVNEDSMTVFDSPNGQVLAVCDGMGGQAAGDVASQLSVSIIENILTDNAFNSPEEAIRRSIMAANQGVLNRTAQNPELEGMGSTCVMLIIKNGRVHCGWVGDSRIYYIANDTIRQISHDQSYVQQLVDSGQITKAEAVNHPQKNEITNCIGLQGMAEPETVAVPILPEPGSVFLLCSDGLSSMVDEAVIERVISSNDMSLQQKADRLVELANEAGGLDNITVELVQFSANDYVGATSGSLYENSEAAAVTKKSPLKALMFGLIGALAVAGIGYGAYAFMNKKPEPKAATTTEKTTNSAPTQATPSQNGGNSGSQATSAPSAPTTVTTSTPSTPKAAAPKNTKEDKAAKTINKVAPKQDDPKKTGDKINRSKDTGKGSTTPPDPTVVKVVQPNTQPPTQQEMEGKNN